MRLRWRISLNLFVCLFSCELLDYFYALRTYVLQSLCELEYEEYIYGKIINLIWRLPRKHIRNVIPGIYASWHYIECVCLECFYTGIQEEVPNICRVYANRNVPYKSSNCILCGCRLDKNKKKRTKFELLNVKFEKSFVKRHCGYFSLNWKFNVYGSFFVNIRITISKD